MPVYIIPTKKKNNYNSNVLMHHGILGQKWGIRRFQNKDGSLTEAGKLRYYDKSISDLSYDEQQENKIILNTRLKSKKDDSKRIKALKRFQASKEFNDAVNNMENSDYMKIEAQVEKVFSDYNSEEYKDLEKKAIEKNKNENNEWSRDLNDVIVDLARDKYLSKASMSRDKYDDAWYEIYKSTTERMASALSDFTGEKINPRSAIVESFYFQVYDNALVALNNKRK